MATIPRLAVVLALGLALGGGWGVPAPAAPCHARGPLPDPRCTPGAVRTTDAAAVCRPGAARAARAVPAAEKAAVYAAYGIVSHPAGAYEVDHLVSLELGGSNDVRNLWPEAASPRPGFHEKDTVEGVLHAAVCAGREPLVAAQRAIAADWRTA